MSDRQADGGRTMADEELLQFLYRAPIGLLQLSLDGAVEMINPMAAQLLMPLAHERTLANLFDCLDGHLPHLRETALDFDEPFGTICESLRFDVGMRRDETRSYAISLIKVGPDRLMGMLVDATVERDREVAARRRHAHVLERTDALTKMPNRVSIAESIRESIDDASPAVDAGEAAPVVLLIGCERLQEIGESFGGDVASRMLERIGRRLRSVVRHAGQAEREPAGQDDVDPSVVAPGEPPHAVARASGDEFVVLLRDLANAADAAVVAQRIIEALARPYAIDARQLVCTVHVGLVRCTNDGRQPEEILRDAHLAMREARRSGGLRWTWFDPSMRQRAERRGSIETELRHAIAAKELFVVYQPVVGLSAKAAAPLAGVEALVRWQHPSRGVVPPVDFIGVAEECGLIGALGGFVLATACRQFVRWSAAFGDEAPRLLAVNLSRAQLSDPTLVASVEAILAESGLAPERLQLEVTESLAAQDDGIQARLHDLKALGVTIALDDFGTGYSSLSSLHLLPVDTVKVDRSFVALIDSSPHHEVLIEATIRVARSLGMSTVAEGIETRAQATMVERLGCDKGQGYLYSKPLTANALEEWLAARCGALAPTEARRG